MIKNRFISDITEFIFVNDIPEKVDIIFIPGSSRHILAEKAALLFNDGFSKYILVTGKYSSKLNVFAKYNVTNSRYEGHYTTEFEFLTKVLTENNVPIERILCEKDSTNSYENAMYSRKVTDEHGLTIKKAIICCQSFHARRILMSYSLAFPEVEFFICPVDTQDITRDNWFQSEYGITRVMGEVKKCGLYFEGYMKELLN